MPPDCDQAVQPTWFALDRLAPDDRGIGPELLPGWEPEAQPVSSGYPVPVLGLDSPAHQASRPPLHSDLPPVVLSTTQRTVPEAVPALEQNDVRLQVRAQLSRESSSGRWRDDFERRQPPDSIPSRPDRNGFDGGADWDRRGDRLLSRENSGRYGPRSALAGPPFNERRSELVDPTLFPPLPPGRSPRHAYQQSADESLADGGFGEAEPPADDRDEFEKELNAVVAELQRVRSGLLLHSNLLCSIACSKAPNRVTHWVVSHPSASFALTWQRCVVHASYLTVCPSVAGEVAEAGADCGPAARPRAGVRTVACSSIAGGGVGAGCRAR